MYFRRPWFTTLIFKSQKISNFASFLTLTPDFVSVFSQLSPRMPMKNIERLLLKLRKLQITRAILHPARWSEGKSLKCFQALYLIEAYDVIFSQIDNS